MKKRILFSLIIVFCVFTFLSEAQKKKQLPISSQPPPKQPRIISFKIYGQVLRYKYKKGVQNIKMELVRTQRIQKITNLRQMQMLVKAPNEITDKYGRYSFLIDPKMEGQKYKLIPKHPNFPAGEHFWPRNKEFTLTKSMKIDFKFSPPIYKVKVISKTNNQMILKRAEYRLHQVLGPHLYKHIETKKGGICKFELDYDYYGKMIRIQPRHLLAGAYEVGFTPKTKQFYFTGNRDVNFVYSGPLPDLTISSVKRPPPLYYCNYKEFR